MHSVYILLPLLRDAVDALSAEIKALLTGPLKGRRTGVGELRKKMEAQSAAQVRCNTQDKPLRFASKGYVSYRINTFKGSSISSSEKLLLLSISIVFVVFIIWTLEKRLVRVHSLIPIISYRDRQICSNASDFPVALLVSFTPTHAPTNPIQKFISTTPPSECHGLLRREREISPRAPNYLQSLYGFEVVTYVLFRMGPSLPMYRSRPILSLFCQRYFCKLNYDSIMVHTFLIVQ